MSKELIDRLRDTRSHTFALWFEAADEIERLEQQRDELLAALDKCRFALEPYDDIKPRDWKTDREKLAFAHQDACAAIASVKEGK